MIAVPIFAEDDFQIWRLKMQTYLQCLDLWDIVMAGYAKSAEWSNIEGEERMKE